MHGVGNRKIVLKNVRSAHNITALTANKYRYCRTVNVSMGICLNNYKFTHKVKNSMANNSKINKCNS